MPSETKSLVRAIGRWSLSALMLNTDGAEKTTAAE
jgi:hypothetical protein